MFKLLRNAIFYCLIFVVIVNCSGGNDEETTPTPAPDLTPTNPPTSTPTQPSTTPPTQAPVTTPTQAPVTPPTQAPVTPPTQAPVTTPTQAPVTTPTQAPVTPPTQAPTPNLGLEISGLDLVAFTDNKDLLTVGSISNGSELDLSTMPTNQINVVAHSSDQAATGSVHFLLQGPLGIDRWENNPIYTMAVDSTNLDISQDQFPLGSYVLTVTPYALPDMGGDSGASMRIAFTVVNTTPIDAPIAAENDRYDIEINTEYNSGSGNAISNNDTFDTNEATFVVVQAPEHGQLTLESTGQFSYSPDLNFTGTDLYTYELRQGAETAQATVTLNVRDNTVPTFPTDKEGFTLITPSADSKIIYVSDSLGSDSNTCLSIADPCKTLSAGAKKMRTGFADHLRLKRGDTWFEQNLQAVPSGRSASEPHVVYFYGDNGLRPKIESSTNTLHKYDLKNVSFIGINFSAYKLITGHPEFTGTSHPKLFFLGPNHNIRFEDNLFDHFELVFQKWTDGRPENISLHRNIWTGAYSNQTSLSQNERPSNLYADGVEVLTITENVIDHGGWHDTTPNAGANMFNHNLYIQSGTDGNKLLLENNIITRASSHGAQLRQGGLAKNNFFARNAIGLLLGYSKTPLPAGTRAYMFDNVASEGHSMIKGNNACAGPNLCTPALWGLEFDRNGAADYQTKNNIVSNTAPNDNEWQKFYSGLVKEGFYFHGDDSQPIQSSGNIEWNWAFLGQGEGPNYKDPGRTLGDYNESLGGNNSFDAFMDIVLNRPLQTWDERYTAAAINDYIREGFSQ